MKTQGYQDYTKYVDEIDQNNGNILLKKELNLVVVAFYDWQKSIANMWMEFFENVAVKYEDLSATFIPLYPQVKVFDEDEVGGSKVSRLKEEFHFPGDLKYIHERKALVLLVREDGTVIWQTQENIGEELKTAIRNLIHLALIIEKT